MKNALRITALTGSVAALAALTGPATANHAWSTYHWSTANGVVEVNVVDNVTSVWDDRLDEAIADWNASPNINVTKANGSTSNTACNIVGGRIDVCNDTYGSTGWLGIASISLSGGHIYGGVTKLNDTYFNQSNYNTYSWRQLVMCQEIGHDFGLGHQNENFNTDETTSCMEYTSLPADNEGPDTHDFDMLAQIYAHDTDGGDGGGDTGGPGKPPKGDKPCRGKKCGSVASGAMPGDWGRAVGYDRSGRANVYARREGDLTVITHVTWVPGYEPDHHDH